MYDVIFARKETLALELTAPKSHLEDLKRCCCNAKASLILLVLKFVKGHLL